MKKLLFLPLIFASCSLAPKYSEPEPTPPCEWKEEIANQQDFIPYDGDFWLLFNDETLTELEEQAILANPNLEIAYQKVLEARAISGVFFSDFFPHFFLEPSTVNTGQLFDSNIPNSLDIIDSKTTVRQHFQQYTFPLVASYEVDLFARIRDSYLASKYEAEARFYAYQAVRLALTTEVANVYFELRSLDAQIRVLKSTIEVRQAALEITESRDEAGLSNYSDVSRSKNLVANAKADLSIVIQARIGAENALAVLLGKNASLFSFPESPLDTLSPSFPPTFPSTLVQQRPDIAEAERNLASQNKRIGVARTGYFPDFLVQGALGFQSQDFNRLFNWEARLWSWATSVTQLVFDAGKTGSIVDTEIAKFNEALGQYIQTVLTAFQEVETALSSQKLTRETFQYFDDAVNASIDTRSISEERYLNGLVTYLDVVDADTSLLSDQLRRERARLETYRSSISLIRALGGGFQRDPCAE